MKLDIRRYEILNLIEKFGEVKITDLANRFGVTEMTIRRDINRLSSLGFIKAVRGGAENKINNENLLFNITLRGRNIDHIEGKKKIGARAAEFIKENQFIFIQGGTTTMELAKKMPRDINFTVITDSNPIASIIGQYNNINTVCTGGIYNRFSETFHGSHAEALIGDIKIDTLFMGASGVSVNSNLTEFDFNISSLKKKIIEVSNIKILLADSHKFFIERHVAFGKIEDFNILITDKDISPDIHSALINKKIKIVLV